MDPVTDIFETMRVAAFLHARIEATAPWGLLHEATETGVAELAHDRHRKIAPNHLAYFGTIARGNCWLTLGGDTTHLNSGDCFLIGSGSSYSLQDAPNTPANSICAAINGQNVIQYGGGGAPTTILSGVLSFETPSVRPMGQLLPALILIRAGQPGAAALHTTLQMLASEVSEGATGSEVVASRLAEVLFIQTVRAHIASGGGERKQGQLSAVFDPQIGSALKAIHQDVRASWTVESLASSAGMSRSAFAARFKDLLGQTPLDYVTEWRMQKAIQLLREKDMKLAEVAQVVGYESDAAFHKAFKRVVGAAPGEYRRNTRNPPAEVEGIGW
jgi:AraC-like DNA-binding protein